VTGDYGGGDVVSIDFASINDIRGLEVVVTQPQGAPIGFGIDNLRFIPIPEPSTFVI
jgi:hypothetical protein